MDLCHILLIAEADEAINQITRAALSEDAVLLDQRHSKAVAADNESISSFDSDILNSPARLLSPAARRAANLAHHSLSISPSVRSGLGLHRASPSGSPNAWSSKLGAQDKFLGKMQHHLAKYADLPLLPIDPQEEHIQSCKSLNCKLRVNCPCAAGILVL
jgi:hypothetical protein